MAEKSKPSFPQTPDGVTDWERVFESDGGLIALIGQAHSAAALRQCAVLVINQLFTRKQDQLEVARLMQQLDKLISDAPAAGEVGTLSTTIIELLREIKRERIDKAREYLANKEQEKGTDRRTDSIHNQLSGRTYGLLNNAKLTKVIVAICFLLLIAIFGTIAYLFILKSPAPTPVHEAQPPSPAPAETQMKAEAPPPKKSRKQNRSNPDMPPTIVFPRIFLPQALNATKVGTEQVLPIFILAERRDQTPLCELQPVIYDALNIQFESHLSDKTGLTDTNLAQVGSAVMRQINSRLGRSAIIRVLLVRKADYRDRPDRKCGLASDKFLKYLK